MPDTTPLPARMPRLLIFLMFLAYTLSYLDRQIVNIVAEHIKRDVGLADWQIGAMSGLAFALLYTTLGIPVARWAERSDRVTIVTVALVIWSGCTTLFGFGRGFTSFFLARIGVGLGEAGASPPAMSMITEATPPEYQARALSIYNLGVPIGALLGMIVGGLIVDSWGWRWAFFVVGPPGLLLAALIRVQLRDPRTEQSESTDVDAIKVPTLREVAGTLRGSPRFWWIAAGAALTTFVGYGQQTFFASFFLRNHGAELASLAASLGLAGPTALLGLTLGLGLGLGGVIGSLLGGQIGDRWRSPNAYVWVPVIGSVLAFPFYTIVLLLPGAGAALALLVVPVALKSLWYGPVYASVQRMTHPRSRTTVMAVFLFILNAIGLGLGPLLIGLLSDLLGRSLGPGEGLRWALIVLSGVSLLSAACFAMARDRRRPTEVFAA